VIAWPATASSDSASSDEPACAASPVGGGDAGPGGGEGVAADQREPLVLGHVEAAAVDEPVGQVGHRAEVPLADRAEPAHRRREALVEQGDDHLGQFGADAGHSLGVAVGQAHHRAADHVGRGRVTLRDPVVEDQPLVEPLPFGGIEQVGLALADPGGQAIYRLAGAENLLHHLARLAHGGDGHGRQRDGRTMPGDRDDLRNSQVTSVKHDRH
jgi:hypothetical protein